jgi:predicted deacylase
MTTPINGRFQIPYHDFGPRKTKPRLALVGGIHGNELNSVFIASRLAAFLSGKKLKKRVIVIPAVNIPGLHTSQRLWPFDKTDINRMFPGYNRGETTQRIAAAVFRYTAPAAQRIDLHASNLEFEELPQVRVYGSSDKERRTARKLGLPAIVECPVNKASASTLLHAWKNLGGENFVIQAGVAGQLQRELCEKVLKALIHFLIEEKMVSDPFHAAPSETPFGRDEPWYFPLRHTVSLISEKAGLFVGLDLLGRWIEEGDLLGDLYDGFTGKLKARVLAPVSGMLTGLRRQALLYEGDLLARIQSTRPVAKGADTYLIGQGQ